MSHLERKESRRNKLALKKRGQPDHGLEERRCGIQRLLSDAVDLNETSEFREPAAFGTSARSNQRSKENTTVPEKSSRKEIATVSSCERDGSQPPDQQGSAGSSREEGSSRETASGKQEVTCQVCNKVLAHMTSQGRLQHVNRCIDRTIEQEKSVKEHYQLLEKAKTAVLDCPMCGKILSTETTRLSHLKKCSQALGVSTENLLRLTREQEADRQAKLDQGILPDSISNLNVKPKGPSKKRKAKEPKSQYEEDVQMALAISTSMFDQEKKQIRDLSARTCMIDGNPSAQGQRVKRIKQTPQYEDVCLLTTLSEEDKQRRMMENVNNILLNEESWHSDDIQSDHKLKASDLQSASAAGKNSSLWNRSLQAPEDSCCERFYVSSLVPPLYISSSTVSSRAKASIPIPGREDTFIEDKGEKSLMPAKMPNSDDIIMASTQTAVVLAELAMDDTGLQSCHESPLTGHLEPQNSGYCTQTLVLQEADQQLENFQAIQAYKQLVNNPTCSDVKIATSDGQTVYAHKLILSVRCPKLLQMCDSSAVTLPASSDLTLSLLNYIYTGQLVLNSSKAEMESLALELDMSALVQLCKKLTYGENSDEVDVPENIQQSSEDFTESKLDLKEIWGESDSDVDIGENGNKVGDSDSCSLDVNSDVDDKYYDDLLCKQRRLARSGRSERGEDSEDTESEDGSESDMKSNNSDICVSNGESSDNVDITNEDVSSEIRPLEHDSKVFDESCSSINLDSKYVAKDRTKDNIQCKRIHLETHIGNLKDTNKEDDTRKLKIDLKEELMISVDVSSDDEIAPSPKRIRISEISKMNKVATNDVIDSTSFSESAQSTAKDKEGNIDHESMNSREKMHLLTDDSSEHDDSESDPRKKKSFGISSVGSLNCSGDDLFCSPTPAKSSYKKGLIFDDADTAKGSFGDISAPSIVLDDNDLEKADECENYSDVPKNVEKNRTDRVASPLKSGFKEVKDKSDSNITNVEDDDSDSDNVEITGDNLDELNPVSPVFKDKRLHKSSGHQEIVKEDKRCVAEGNGSRSATCNDWEKENICEYFNESFNDDFDKINQSDTRDSHGTTTFDKANEFENKKTETKTITDNINIEWNVGNNDKKQPAIIIDKDETVFLGGAKLSVSTSDVSAVVEAEDTVTERCRIGAFDAVSNHNVEAVDLTMSDSDAREVEDTQGSPHNTNDVWEDFYDDGMGCVPPVHSPGSNDDLDEEDSFVFHVATPNDGQELRPARDSQTQAVIVTPTVQKPKHSRKRPWVALSPFTPMPEYDKMATPQIKKAVQKYGVKPVGKKRMVKMLKDIYHQTHQYETDSECEELADPVEAARASPGRACAEDTEVESLFSQEELSGDESNSSDNIFEESCLHLASSGSETSSPQKSVDVQMQILSYIKKNTELHRRILVYDPLELDVLKADLKQAQIKCSLDKLMDFLDERCIAFTTKNTRSGRRGRQKKSSPRKNTTKSPKKKSNDPKSHKGMEQMLSSKPKSRKTGKKHTQHILDDP